MLNNKAVVIFASVSITLAIITVAFGYTGYSLHGSLDSTFFIPPAISLAIGQGFRNPISDLRSEWGDPTGQERYLYFPPLFSLVISSFILKTSSIPPSQQAFLGTGILSAIAILLTSLVFYKVATLHGKKFDFLSAFLISSILFIILRTLWSIMSRPETLESIFLATGFLIALGARRPWKLIISFATILGLMAATHPFGTLFFASFVGLFFSFIYKWRRSLAYTGAVYALGVVAFFVIMQASPYGIFETFTGVLNHSSHELQRISIDLAVVFIKSPHAILYGMMMIFSAFFCAHFYLRHRDRIKALFPFLIFATIICFLMAYFILIEIKTYYALLFSILIFSFFIYYITHVLNIRPLKYSLLLFVAFFAVLSLKTLLIFPFYIKDGTSIANGRVEFEKIIARYPRTDMFLAGSLWVLSENYDQFHSISDLPMDRKTRPPLLIVLDQNQSYMELDPTPEPLTEVEGCPLIENRFVGKIPELFGVKLANAMPGYGFAVYECK